MKTLIVLMALVGSAFAASANAAVKAGGGGNLKITPSMLRFTYETVDGSSVLDCTEVLTNPDSQDWDVTCGKGRDARKYTVHLWVTEYDHASVPKQSFEVLYWVTDLNQTQPVSNSTTFWFHFREASDLYAIQVHNSLEQDTAELELEITPNP